MPDPALPQPLGRTAGGGAVFRCPRGARIAGTPGSHCSICDCGRRTDTGTTLSGEKD